MLLVKLCKADGPGARSLLGLWKWLVLLRGLFLLQDLFCMQEGEFLISRSILETTRCLASSNILEDGDHLLAA